MTWIDIGGLEDIPRRGARVLRTAQGCVAVFRTADDRVFALDDRCPHRGGPLSEGIVHGDAVTCPLHGMVIGLADGRARDAEGGGVGTYPARIEGGRILIDAARLLPKGRAA